jgi:hypothetical protein
MVKGKVIPVHAMKAYRRSRGIAPRILNLGTRWTSVLSFRPQSLYSRERTYGIGICMGPALWAF